MRLAETLNVSSVAGFLEKNPMREKYFYIEFVIGKHERFERLSRFFDALKAFKDEQLTAWESGEALLEDEDRATDPAWLDFLDEEALDWFTDTFDFKSEEGQVYSTLWKLAAPEVRHSDPMFVLPGNWDFESMLEAIFKAKYILVDLIREDDRRGVLTYDPLAFPWGSTESLFALLEAFGNQVTYDSWTDGPPQPRQSGWDNAVAKTLLESAEHHPQQRSAAADQADKPAPNLTKTTSLPDPVTTLIARLSDPDKNIRAEAAAQLGRLRNDQAVEPLVQCLRDPSDKVQVAAATALGAIGDVRAVSPLIGMFRAETYPLLSRDGSPGLYYRIVASAGHALAQIGTAPAVEAIFRQLQNISSGDNLTTMAALAAIGAVRDPRTLPTLLFALQSSDRLLRLEAARSLGHFGHPQALEPLIQRLRDPDPFVQIAAAEALGTLGDARAVESLTDVFKRGSTYISTSRDYRTCLQAKAARGLALIGEEASLQLLERNLQAKQWGRRTTAAIGLAYRQDPRTIPILSDAKDTSLIAVRDELDEVLAQFDTQEANEGFS